MILGLGWFIYDKSYLLSLLFIYFSHPDVWLRSILIRVLLNGWNIIIIIYWLVSGSLASCILSFRGLIRVQVIFSPNMKFTSNVPLMTVLCGAVFSFISTFVSLTFFRRSLLSFPIFSSLNISWETINLSQRTSHQMIKDAPSTLKE